MHKTVFKMSDSEKRIIKGLTILLFIFVLFLSADTAQAIVRLGSLTGLEVPVRVATDADGDVYVTESVYDRIVIFNSQGQLKKIMYGLNSPIGVAVDANKRLYVGNENSHGNTMPAGPNASVDIYDSNLIYQFSLGKGKGEFTKPNAIAVHGNGTIYVSDNKANEIRIYNSNGSLRGSFGGWGMDDGKFNGPLGIALDEGNGELYVTDLGIFIDPVYGPTSGARIQVFDLGGGFKRSFGDYATGDGKMIRPTDIAYKDGKIYVVDAYQSVAQVFDGNGVYIETIYDLQYPMRTTTGIAVGRDNRIFIVSMNTRTVEIYGMPGYTSLTVTPGELTYKMQQGANPQPQDITISNTGTGTMNWSISTETSWITIGQRNGEIAGTGSATAAIGIEAGTLNTGTYTGQIRVDANGATATVNVALEVLPAPTLTANPGSLIFTGQEGGGRPASETLVIEILNDAAKTYTWNAEDDAIWLSMTPLSGGSTAQTLSSVSVDTTGLTEGAYNGVITVTSAGAQGSPKTVGVTLNIIKAGDITVTTNLNEAGFTITGPATYKGGGTSWTQKDVPAGQYSINFDSVAGYRKPAMKTFTVTTGQGAVINAEYKDLRENRKIIAGLGSGLANPTQVRALNTDGTSAGANFTAFTTLKYGVHVAAGDIDGDGIDEIIAGAGEYSTNPARVKIFRANGAAIAGLDFLAFTTKYGVNVAAADLDGDGKAEIIAGMGSGKGNTTNVRVFTVQNGKITDTGINFINDSAGSGVSVAAGDVDGDGSLEIITGTEKGAPAVVKTWEVDTSAGIGRWTVRQNMNFRAFPSSMGIKVATGDLNADGTDEIIVSAETGRNLSSVKTFKADGTPYGVNIIETNVGGGVTISAGDTNADGESEIVVGTGSLKLNSARIKIYSSDGILMNSFVPFTQKGGVNVGLGVLD